MDFTKAKETAANAHALETLGEEQFNNPEFETAKQAVTEDFKAGTDWLLEYQLENKTDANFRLVSSFQEYVNENFDITIPDELVESFFNA